MIKQRICKNCRYLHMKRRNKAGESLCMVHHEYVNEADLCPDHQFHFKFLGYKTKEQITKECFE